VYVSIVSVNCVVLCWICLDDIGLCWVVLG